MLNNFLFDVFSDKFTTLSVSLSSEKYIAQIGQDKIGKVRKFKLFRSKDANSIFLLEVDLKKIPLILIKVKALNS